MPSFLLPASRLQLVCFLHLAVSGDCKCKHIANVCAQFLNAEQIMTTRRIIDGPHSRILLQYAKASAADVEATKQYLIQLFELDHDCDESLWVACGPRTAQFVVGFTTGAQLQQLQANRIDVLKQTLQRSDVDRTPSFIAMNWENSQIGKPWVGTRINGSVLRVELTPYGLVNTPPIHDNDLDTLIAAGFDMAFDRRTSDERDELLQTSRKQAFKIAR